MTAASPFKPHNVQQTNLPDGTILLRSGYDLGTVVDKTGVWLHHWAKQKPDRVFLAERSGAGWQTETFAATLDKVRAIARALLGRGLNADTPILIMSGNGVDHGLLTLAAQYVGIPTVPVAEQYSLIPAAHDRLRHVIDLVKPAMAYVVDAEKYGAAIAIDELTNVEIVASINGSAGVTAFDELLKGDVLVDPDAAYAGVTPDTVAKILMTSGSTSSPKGVLTTQKMMCVNQTQIAGALPFLHDQPPCLLDWLPWNHVFGGSHNFNMMLANGGSLYIDDGKPAPGLFDRTLENLSMITGTISFNVPVGYAMLLAELKNNKPLQHRFFENLDMLFYAGASLPQDIWQGLEDMAVEIKGRAPLMTSSWGLTETAPACVLKHEPTGGSGIIGVPLSGITAKLTPNDGTRYEIRVKGPSITKGYFNNPEKTADSFDDQGYLITGDAVCFVDSTNPDAGLRFDGRISEDFKLLTGTWVRASTLRVELLGCLAPLASDVIITGTDRADVGLLIFPNFAAIKAAGFSAESVDGYLTDPGLISALHSRLGNRPGQSAGSSEKIARLMVLGDPASMADGEITTKGSLNIRKILTKRAGLLSLLYTDNQFNL